MSGNVGIFVDLILLALLLIGLVLGWRQGFVQALTRIIVVVAALLLAGAPALAEERTRSYGAAAGQLDRREAGGAGGQMAGTDPVREAGAAADGTGQYQRRRRDAGGLRL